MKAKYFSSGLLVFSHVLLVGMELEVQVPKICSSIKYEVSSCSTPKCKELVNNYYQCTRALGGYAQEDNREAFRHTWYFHRKVREYELNLNIPKKDQKTSVLETAMEWYKKSYDTEEKVRENIDNLTVKVFERKNGKMLLLLCRGKKLAIPHIKTKDLFESLWVMQNADLVGKYHETYGYKDKQKTFEWIIKNGGKPHFIFGLIEKRYIAIDADKDGRTPAHLAIIHDRFDLLDCLFAQGVKVNDVDADGRTPLHYAVLYADVRAVKLLINRKGINKNIVDKHNKSAFDYSNISWKKKIKLHMQGDDVSDLEDRCEKIQALFKETI
jgi:hypothetical protein